MNKAIVFLRRYNRFFISALFLGLYIVGLEFLFYIVVVMELAQIFVGRIYCGYACPYGIIQAVFASVGKKLFPTKFGKIIPERVHKMLSCIRYISIIALLFFATTIMGDVFSNVYAPDIRILTSYGTYSHLALVWLVCFGFIGLFVERPFCKYFCSGSCFAGAFSHVKLFKTKRNKDICTNCKRCEKVCPMSVPITKLEVVESHNCISCYKCLDKGVCPHKGALYLECKPKVNWGDKH